MEIKVGDEVALKDHVVKVCSCERCGAKMAWVNQQKLTPEDLIVLKKLDITLSNPHTADHVCISCEVEREDKERAEKTRLAEYMRKKREDDADEEERRKKRQEDDSYHHKQSSSFFGGGGGGFGGFGGFGGGSFSGGGASGGW